jgi:ribosomal protein S18 acetylase RimI-like enzyme
MINIRPAKLDDVPQLVTFLKALFAIEADFEFDQHKQSQGLKLLLKSGTACILVAESSDDGTLCGMCSIQILISTAEGGPVGLLEDLIINEGFRNQGMGAKLLAEAVEWSERQGLTRLQLLADKHNLPALSFYQKQGWHATQLVCLKKPLASKVSHSSEP